jgi:hypothetical protein
MQASMWIDPLVRRKRLVRERGRRRQRQRERGERMRLGSSSSGGGGGVRDGCAERSADLDGTSRRIAVGRTTTEPGLWSGYGGKAGVARDTTDDERE